MFFVPRFCCCCCYAFLRALCALCQRGAKRFVRAVSVLLRSVVLPPLLASLRFVCSVGFGGKDGSPPAARWYGIAPVNVSFVSFFVFFVFVLYFDFWGGIMYAASCCLPAAPSNVPNFGWCQKLIFPSSKA